MTQQSSPILPVILFLVAANGALGALVYGELTNPDLFVRRMQIGEAEAPPPSTVGARPGSEAAPSIPGEAAFAVISNRPLFAPDRLPPETPRETPSGPVSSQPPSLIVTGIVGAGEESIAILTDPSVRGRSESGFVVRPGDTVQGWTVEAVLPEERKVVLVNGERRHELVMVEDQPGPARPAVPSVRPPVVRPQRTAPQAVSPGAVQRQLRTPQQQGSTQ